MNKLNLLALAATPALTPGTVLVAKQNLSAQDIFDKMLDGHKIDKAILKEIVKKKIDEAEQDPSIDGDIRLKLLTFYIKFDQETKNNPSLINDLYNKFKIKEPNAFYKDPTSSFVDYVADKLVENIKSSNEITDLSEMQKIIDDFIVEMNSPNFLDDFGNTKGQNKFNEEVDKEMDHLANDYNISPNTLNPIKDRIVNKYSDMLLTLVSDENNYSQAGEPYYITEGAFNKAVEKTIEDELKSVDTAPIISSGVKAELEKEFKELLNDKNNLQRDFSPKTLDYLKFYLKDNEEPIKSPYLGKSDYFFKTLFGENQTNWKPKVITFWDKWFGLNKDPDVSVKINKYDDFKIDNGKANIKIGFGVTVNGIPALNSDSKTYEANFNKPNDHWDAKYIEEWINDNLKKITNKLIKEWEDEGYKISEDPKNLVNNFWDVLKAQNIINIDDEIQKDSNLKITRNDFKLTVTKQDDKWIFKISIDKDFAQGSLDPVAQKYNKLKDDDIIDIEFETIIYDITQNLLKPAVLPAIYTNEVLKRSEIYSGIYQDDLKALLQDYPDGLIPLKELENNGKLRELFKSRYTEIEIDQFIQYIKDLSLNNDRYSMTNSTGGIGKIGYRYISSPSWDKSGYFELFIENEKGVVQNPVSIKDDNLKIYKYTDPYDHFKELLENTKIDKAHALKPGQQLNIPNKWPILMQIIPDLDSGGTALEKTALYLRTFARIYGLENHFRIEYEDNITKVIFTLNNGQEYEKIISLDALTQTEKDDFKNKTNNRLDQIKSYIDKIQDQDLKTKIEDLYQNKRNNIDNLQTKDDAQDISDKVIELVDEITKAVSQDEKEILFDELKKRYPNGIPEEIEEKIKKWINDKENDLLNKSEREIENILDTGKDLYEDIRNINIDTLLNINKTLTNFEKYGIIALGGVLAVDSVAAGAVAYGISRKNKKLAATNKTKMKRAKSLVIFNLAISLLTAGGSVAMFILIFIIKGGL